MTLKSLYPDITWKNEWFKNRKKYSRNYWETKENRIAFLEEIFRKNHLQSSFDWRKVTNTLIKQNGGEVSQRKYKHNLHLGTSQQIWRFFNGSVTRFFSTAKLESHDWI